VPDTVSRHCEVPNTKIGRNSMGFGKMGAFFKGRTQTLLNPEFIKKLQIEKYKRKKGILESRANGPHLSFKLNYSD